MLSGPIRPLNEMEFSYKVDPPYAPWKIREWEDSRMDWLNADTLQLAGIVGIIAFLWSLHRDVRSLSERVARLEGAFEGLRDAMGRLEDRMAGVENRQGQKT